MANDPRGTRRSRWTPSDVSRARPSAGRSDRATCSSRVPDGPVTRDESPVGRARGARSQRSAARSRHGPGRAAERTTRTAVRPLAVQRPSALLRLHHRAAGADRHARRLPRGGGQPERRRLDAGAGRHRDRSADGALDRRADRLSGRLRRAARRAAATWRTSSASSRRARRRPAGTCASRASPAAQAARLRVYALGRNAHVDPEGRRSAGLGTDAIRWIPTDAELRMDVAALRAADRRGPRRRRPAVPRRRHGRLGQHRRRRSAAGDRRALPRARRLVPRRRRLRRLRGAPCPKRPTTCAR